MRVAASSPAWFTLRARSRKSRCCWVRIIPGLCDDWSCPVAVEFEFGWLRGGPWLVELHRHWCCANGGVGRHLMYPRALNALTWNDKERSASGSGSIFQHADV